MLLEVKEEIDVKETERDVVKEESEEEDQLVKEDSKEDSKDSKKLM